MRYFMSILVLQSTRWGRELIGLFCLSSRCLVIDVWLFLTMPRVCLQFVIVVFPEYTHLLFTDNHNYLYTQLGDNCIQNFHLGRCIVGYTFGN